MMKKYVLIILISIVILTGFFIGIRWWVIRYVSSVSSWLSMKAEVAYSVGSSSDCDRIEILRDTVTILFIGNSITYHTPLKDIGWHGQWGMAASKPENDYVHILQKLLVKRKGLKVVNILPVNIIKWEQNFGVDKDSLLGDVLKKADVVIVRLGENVPETHVSDFQKALLDLLNYCEKQTRQIIITGVFWQHPQKDAALMEIARRTGHPFVPLSWIHELYNVCPSVGDTLYNKQMNPYTINSNFIIAHPNDEGMFMIAREIERQFR